MAGQRDAAAGWGAAAAGVGCCSGRAAERRAVGGGGARLAGQQTQRQTQSRLQAEAQWRQAAAAGARQGEVGVLCGAALCCCAPPAGLQLSSLQTPRRHGPPASGRGPPAHSQQQRQWQRVGGGRGRGRGRGAEPKEAAAGEGAQGGAARRGPTPARRWARASARAARQQAGNMHSGSTQAAARGRHSRRAQRSARACVTCCHRRR